MIQAKHLSGDVKFAFAIFQIKEKKRHQEDIKQIDIDLANLRDMGVDVDLAETVDMGFVTTEEVA